MNNEYSEIIEYSMWEIDIGIWYLMINLYRLYKNGGFHVLF